MKNLPKNLEIAWAMGSTASWGCSLCASPRGGLRPPLSYVVLFWDMEFSRAEQKIYWCRKWFTAIVTFVIFMAFMNINSNSNILCTWFICSENSLLKCFWPSWTFVNCVDEIFQIACFRIYFSFLIYILDTYKVNEQRFQRMG